MSLITLTVVNSWSLVDGKAPNKVGDSIAGDETAESSILDYLVTWIYGKRRTLQLKCSVAPKWHQSFNSQSIFWHTLVHFRNLSARHNSYGNGNHSLGPHIAFPNGKKSIVCRRLSQREWDGSPEELR